MSTTVKRTSWGLWLAINGLCALLMYLWLGEGSAVAGALFYTLAIVSFVFAGVIGSVMWVLIPKHFKALMEQEPEKMDADAKALAGKMLNATASLAKQGRVINLLRAAAFDIPVCLILAATGHIVLAFMWAFGLFTLFRMRYFYRDALLLVRDLHNRHAALAGMPLINEDDYREGIK